MGGDFAKKKEMVVSVDNFFPVFPSGYCLRTLFKLTAFEVVTTKKDFQLIASLF